MNYSNNNQSSGNCPVLYLVVPCYNEEEVILKTSKVLLDKLKELENKEIISANSRIMFVNDGSKDNTLKLLHEISETDDSFAVVALAANVGHQNAIFAGMMAAKGADIAVTIDADLQQDINALDEFIEKYKNGAEVVYGVRNDRNTDGFFKRFTALAYYKLIQMLGGNVITNHADYRLVSRKVLDALAEYKEANLFLRGLIPSMGFPSDIVYFDVKEREAGTSKYTLSKMLSLAFNGITSFTTRPLHIISGMGSVTILLSIILCICSIVEWFQGKNVPGYTTLLIVTLIMSGVILLSLGIIGEYIGKIYTEAKARPKYIVDHIILKGDISKSEENKNEN